MSQGSIPAAIVALLAVAAVSDATRHRIPNALAVAVAVLAVVGRALSGGLSGGASGVAALVVTGVVLLPAWRRNALGGGDLKLAAAAAAWVGLAGVPVYLLASALAGGVLAIACYFASARDARRAVRANLLAGGGIVPGTAVGGAVAGRVPLPAGAAFAAGATLATIFGG